MLTIRVGSEGEEVRTWQRVLVSGPKPTTWTNAGGEHRTWGADWPWPLDIDGKFGERTKAATESWQEAHGLLADGVVGPRTWDAAGGATDVSVVDDDAPAIPFVQAKNFTRGRTLPIRVLVIHATHSPEKNGAAKATANWFATQPKRGTIQKDGKPWGGTSAHYTVDRDEIVQSVLDGDTAWHAGAVNGYSIGIEHAGMGDQTAAQWNDEYSKKELLRSAELTAQLALRYGIPVKRLSIDQLRAGESGFCGHLDVTKAFGPKGGHTDPGNEFPWDWYLAQVAEKAGVAVTTTPTDDTKWVPLTYAGESWLVASTYIGPVGIGEALRIAQQKDCVLPTPGLVDAIWKAADRRLDATKLVRTDLQRYDAAEMTDPKLIADQLARIAHETGAAPYTLLAGAFKDVVRHPDGRIGLYGWQRADGSVIQPFYDRHAPSWKDYSQGLRLVKRAPAARG